MKKLLLLLAMVVAFSAYSQDRPLSFSEVIPVEGKTQAEIYGGLREWVATSYVNAKAVTQMEDAQSATIILKALFPFKKGGFYIAYTGQVDYMIKLQAKDGRFRVEMSQMSHSVKPGNHAGSALGLLTTAEEYGKGGLSKGAHNKIWKQLKEKSKEQFDELTASLKQLKSFNASVEEEW